MTGAYVSHAAVVLRTASQLRKGKEAMDETERGRDQTDIQNIKPWMQRRKMEGKNFGVRKS